MCMSNFNSAYWVILHASLSSADFFKINFTKNSLKNAIRVSNCFVVSDLGPNCLQRLSAEDISRQRVDVFTVHIF